MQPTQEKHLSGAPLSFSLPGPYSQHVFFLLTVYRAKNVFVTGTPFQPNVM